LRSTISPSSARIIPPPVPFAAETNRFPVKRASPFTSNSYPAVGVCPFTPRVPPTTPLPLDPQPPSLTLIQKAFSPIGTVCPETEGPNPIPNQDCNCRFERVLLAPSWFLPRINVLPAPLKLIPPPVVLLFWGTFICWLKLVTPLDHSANPKVLLSVPLATPEAVVKNLNSDDPSVKNIL